MQRDQPGPEPPERWPPPEELGALPWFVLTGAEPETQTWLTISATPNASTGVDGEPRPCGYRDARGRLFRLGADGVVPLIDFAAQ